MKSDYEAWALLSASGEIMSIYRTRSECIAYGRWLIGNLQTWKQCKSSYGMSVRRVSVYLHNQHEDKDDEIPK